MAVGIRGSAVAAAIAVVASLGLMLTGTASVAAGSQQARLSVSPASGPAGSQAQVQGSGFSQGQAVEILWADTGKVLATTTGTAFAATVTIPGDAAEGSHTIAARDKPEADASGGRRAFASFTVSAASQEGSDDAATDDDGEEPEFSSGAPEDDERSSNRTGASPDGDPSDEAAEGGSDDGEDASNDDESGQGGPNGEAKPSSNESTGETTDKAGDEGQATADDDGNSSSRPAYRKSSGGSPTTVAGQSRRVQPTAIEGRPDTELPPDIDWAATPDADAFEVQDPEVAGPVTSDSVGKRRTVRPPALARRATGGGSDDVVAQSSPQRRFLAAQRLVAMGLFNQNGAVTDSSTQGAPAVVNAPLTAPNSQELSLVLLAVSGGVIIWHRRRLMTPAPARARSSTLPSPNAHRG